PGARLLDGAGALVAVRRHAAGRVAGGAARRVLLVHGAIDTHPLPGPAELLLRRAALLEPHHHRPLQDLAGAVGVGDVVLLLEDGRAGRERLLAIAVRRDRVRRGEDADAVEVVIGRPAAVAHLGEGRGVVLQEQRLGGRAVVAVVATGGQREERGEQEARGAVRQHVFTPG